MCGTGLPPVTRRPSAHHLALTLTAQGATADSFLLQGLKPAPLVSCFLSDPASRVVATVWSPLAFRLCSAGLQPGKCLTVEGMLT
jgi:hypothetical protein